jgi:uncharacterized membrane protein YbhN (UPF0104 family)
MRESAMELERTHAYPGRTSLASPSSPAEGSLDRDGSIGGTGGPPRGGDAPEPLGRKFLRPQTLVSFGLAVFIVLFFFRQLKVDPAAVWQNIRHTNLVLYACAFLVFYGAFVLRAVRWRMMLARVGIDEAHGYPVPGLRGLIEIFLLSWFVNCVVPAKLGDAYRGYLLKRQCGAPFSTSLGTIFAERLTDLTVLFLMMAGSALFVFGGHLPGQASQTVWIGSALLAIGAMGLVVLWIARGPIQRRLPIRFQEQFARLHLALFACLRRPEPFLAFSVGIWCCEGLRLWLVARALGVEVTPPTALFVGLMGSLLTTLPITPAGLGVVEIATIKVLQLVDVETDLAGSIALLDRVVGYWSVIAIGLALYLLRVRRELAGGANRSLAGADAPAD